MSTKKTSASKSDAKKTDSKKPAAKSAPAKNEPAKAKTPPAKPAAKAVAKPAAKATTTPKPVPATTAKAEPKKPVSKAVEKPVIKAEPAAKDTKTGKAAVGAVIGAVQQTAQVEAAPFGIEEAKDMFLSCFPSLVNLALKHYTEEAMFPKPIPVDPWVALGDISGYVISDASGDIAAYDSAPASDENKHVIDDEEEAHAIKALIQLRRFYRKAVGDWKPDWNTNGGFKRKGKKSGISYYHKDKWVVLFIKDEPTTQGMYENNRAFAFPTEAQAKEFLNEHRDLIILAKPFV